MIKFKILLVVLTHICIAEYATCNLQYATSKWNYLVNREIYKRLDSKLVKEVFYHAVRDTEVIYPYTRWHTEEKKEYGPYGISVKLAQDYLKINYMNFSRSYTMAVIPLIHEDVRDWYFNDLARATHSNVYKMALWWKHGRNTKLTRSRKADEFFNLYNSLLKIKEDK